MRQQELCDEEQLPDRMVNPFEYQQLPQSRDNIEDEGGVDTDNVPFNCGYILSLAVLNTPRLACINFSVFKQ